MGSAIKSQSLKESGTCLPLTNYIFTFRHLEERLSRSWLLPELFFFVSFLLTQTRQFRILFLVMEVLCLSKALYLRGKARQLAVLNFNNSPKTHLVALKCGSAREFVISVILNSISKPQPTCVPCFNWWTLRERTAPRKPAGHMAA